MNTIKTDYFNSGKLSIKERIESGKLLRKKFSRENLGEYKSADGRKDPVSVLEEQAKSRLQELVPVRYARMLTSSFAFLRGAAGIMASDLYANENTTGINVQACGDMHISNFGIFGTAERNIVFGINDYDETIPGPFEWDLKRLLTSFVTAGRFIGADEKLCKDAVKAGVKSYKKHMKQFAFMGNMELHYLSISENEIMKSLSPSARKGAERVIRKARLRTNLQVLGKLTDIVDSKNCFREDAPFIIRQTHSQSGVPIEEALRALLESYFLSIADDRKKLLEHYRIVDVARKVVGVGSVGTRCWIIFLQGNHKDDPLFLQVKEAQTSVLEPFLSKSVYSNHGRRVIEGQRLIQGAPDIFLGWGEFEEYHYYVRQLRDMKGGIELAPGKVKLQNYPDYCALCTWALALAHAKSGDPAVIYGYSGNSDELDKAMVSFAFAYAEQTEKDYNALKAAAESGRIKVAGSGS